MKLCSSALHHGKQRIVAYNRLPQSTIYTFMHFLITQVHNLIKYLENNNFTHLDILRSIFSHHYDFYLYTALCLQFRTIAFIRHRPAQADWLLFYTWEPARGCSPVSVQLYNSCCLRTCVYTSCSFWADAHLRTTRHIACKVSRPHSGSGQRPYCSGWPWRHCGAI